MMAIVKGDTTEELPGEPLVVGVCYDFASSISFVAHRVMERLAEPLEELALELKWIPIDLTRVSDWRRGDRIGGRRLQGVHDVSTDLGVSLNVPPLWMDTRGAGRVALELLDRGPEGASLERQFREAVWSEVFERGESLDDPAVLTHLVESLGLQIPEPSATEDRLALQTDEMAELGVHGVPSFVLGGFPVGGIQSEGTMLRFLTRFAEKTRASAPLAH